MHGQIALSAVFEALNPIFTRRIRIEFISLPIITATLHTLTADFDSYTKSPSEISANHITDANSGFHWALQVEAPGHVILRYRWQVKTCGIYPNRRSNQKFPDTVRLVEFSRKRDG